MKEYQETELEEEQSTSDQTEEELDASDEKTQPFDPKKIDIIVESKSLDLLIKRIKNNEIDMNTDFQRRGDLWDKKNMSRLIESILIRFPMPAFYFDASSEENWLIVDGLQRLSSIKKFVIDKTLRLSDLEFLTELNGKLYDELPRIYQRRIEECTLTAYLIRSGTPDNVKYSVFRRINTGGLTLNNQEIRNALAKPRDRALLQELTQHSDFKLLLGNLSKRMKDQELVLRFWAFYKFEYLDPKNKKEMSLFLDRAMDEIKKADDQYLKSIKLIFDKAIQRCSRLLGETAFEREPSSRSRKNAALFEVWMVSLAKLSDAEFEKILLNCIKFRENANQLFRDAIYSNAITYSTQKKDHVQTRYQKINELIKRFLDD